MYTYVYTIYFLGLPSIGFVVSLELFEESVETSVVAVVCLVVVMLSMSRLVESISDKWVVSTLICKHDIIRLLLFTCIYASLQLYSLKALTTWTVFILTIFYFSRFADACTSILFLQSLETCFIPCTSSTIDGAVPSGPFTPFTIDRWRIRFLRRLFFFG